MKTIFSSENYEENNPLHNLLKFDPKSVPPPPSTEEAEKTLQRLKDENEEKFNEWQRELERKFWYDKPEDWKTDEEAQKGKT
tara:strand:+ start:12839 stop:13084 length:246 start_codon:yes stop_codon:yes gene_type:complete